MKISDEFIKQPWALLKNPKIKTSSRLEGRRDNFLLMMEHMEKMALLGPVGIPKVIIETGTAHDPDNFEGQGQSTLLWDWFSTHYPVDIYSLDDREEPKQYVEKLLKGNRTKFVIGDSVKTLAEFDRDILARTYLLYLDSFDWTPQLNIESAHHHLAELCAVYALLPSGCMVVVDDRHGELKGKHFMVEVFFQHLNVKPAFKNYQIGFVKP